jgi:hypothetical protein
MVSLFGSGVAGTDGLAPDKVVGLHGATEGDGILEAGRSPLPGGRFCKTESRGTRPNGDEAGALEDRAPSARPRTIASAAIMPEAPARFSTIMHCPGSGETASATNQETKSLVPPVRSHPECGVVGQDRGLRGRNARYDIEQQQGGEARSAAHDVSSLVLGRKPSPRRAARQARMAVPPRKAHASHQLQQQREKFFNFTRNDAGGPRATARSA